MSTGDNREDREILAAAITTGTVAVDAHVAAELAAGLLEIAELAMPDSYFAADSRCQLARAVLNRLGDRRAGDYRTD
jgi:hypothetical protein